MPRAGHQTGHEGDAEAKQCQGKEDGDQENNDSADQISTDGLEWTCLRFRQGICAEYYAIGAARRRR